MRKTIDILKYVEEVQNIIDNGHEAELNFIMSDGGIMEWEFTDYNTHGLFCPWYGKSEAFCSWRRFRSLIGNALVRKAKVKINDNGVQQKIAEAERKAVEKCLKIAEGMKMIGPSPIGALHGAGWNDVVGHIVEGIKNLNELGKEGKQSC